MHTNRGLGRLVRNPRELLRSGKGNVELWANLLIIAWAIAFMLWQGVGFAATVGAVFAIWAILAVSLNLVVGFTGLLSVGHIGFFGIGAYTMAILSSDQAYEQLRTEAIPTYGWPFFAALPVSVLLTGLVALAAGGVFNRFRDDIFVLVSFGFAIISYNVFLNWGSVTRGAFGIHQIPRPQIGAWVFDGEWEFLLLTLVFLALVTLVSWLIVTSSFGRVLTAIREDEQAIEVFGYQATHYKLAIWVVSAMMAGLAGGLFSSWTSFIDPNSFILLESILLVSIVILGGLASIWGSLLGAMAFVLLEEGMRFLPLLPDGARGSSASGDPRHTLSAADAVPAARTGGEVPAMSAADSPRTIRPGDGLHLEALRRRSGHRPAQPLHSTGEDDQHRRPQRLGEIDSGKPPERDVAPRRRDGHRRRRRSQGREGS